jgi:hypothetical protein
MEPNLELRWCLSIIRKLFKLASQDIFHANHRNGLGFYVFILLSLVAIWCYAATIIDDQFDMLTRFSCVSVLCGSIQVPKFINMAVGRVSLKNKFNFLQIIIKYYFLRDLQHLLPTIEFIADIYEKNAQPTQYYGICQKFARISRLTIKFGLGLYLIVLLIAALSGSIETMFTGFYKPTMCIYYPGIHEYSTGMIVLSFIFNHVMAVLDIILITPADMFFFILFANMPMVPLVIKGHLDELERLLEQKWNVVNAIAIKPRILQLIQMQRQYNE